MTPRQPDRRRFLMWVGATLGAAGFGAAGVRLARSPDPATSTSTLDAGADTTGPATSTTKAGSPTTGVGESTTVVPTTAPPSTSEPGSTVPSTAVPSTTVPSTTVPSTTEPPSTTVATTQAPVTTTEVPEAPPDGAITAICRDSWGARAPGRGMSDHTIERLTVHHTAAFLGDNSDAPGKLRGHQRFHMDDRGWPDLAYHYVIDAHGYAYEGRATAKVGDTATSYDPTGHFLVCLEGNFDDQAVPERQMAGLVDLLAWASNRFGVAAKTITGHRDHASTTCPGANVYASIEDRSLRRAVERRLEGGPPALRLVCGEDGDAFVARIEAGTA